MTEVRRILSIVLATALTAAAIASATSPANAAPGTEPGSVVSVEPLGHRLWLPGTAHAERITYWTVGSDGKPALSSGAYFVPAGTPPPGGWPVIAWAHGTSGLADKCAPSLAGPALPQRDDPYLAAWLAHGYAIAASDYVGLGTPGPHPYLDVKVEAHSVVDMVRASHRVAPAMSNRWAVIGQSQGGAAAVGTARYATEFGGPGLDYRGGVGTGVPAYLEDVLLPLGPGIPPAAVPAGMTSYVFYILAGLRDSHPELDINSYLTPLGREFVDKAENLCTDDAHEAAEGAVLGQMFSKPLADIPHFHDVLFDYMGIPVTGYNRPVFIGQGLTDIDVPAPMALALAAAMKANGQPVTLRVYNSDHSGTFIASQRDVMPFVDRLFQ